MPVDRTWDQRILDVISSGVDETLIEENLRLTPTQRVEQMIMLLQQLDQMTQASDDHRLSRTP